MNHNPKDKLGKHSYSSGDFGLTDDYIRDRFSKYTKDAYNL